MFLVYRYRPNFRSVKYDSVLVSRLARDYNELYQNDLDLNYRNNGMRSRS